MLFCDDEGFVHQASEEIENLGRYDIVSDAHGLGRIERPTACKD